MMMLGVHAISVPRLVMLLVVISDALGLYVREGVLQVDIERNRVVDSMGRERYFHGVNVVVKGPPWIPIVDKFDPDWSFSVKDMETLQQLGLNGIR